MKEDNSKANYNYPGLSIDEIIENPEEYIIPECIDACKSFWDKNIFTASCRKRNKKKDKEGNIKKFIMVSNLSDENAKIFDKLIEEKPNNYLKLNISDKIYYAIFILSKDNIEDRDIDSQKLLDLASSFKMQDCLEGFLSLEDYFRENLTGDLYITKSTPLQVPEEEIIERVKQHLTFFGKIDLLDLDRKVVYNSKFYKEAHEKYLKSQEQER